MRTADDSAATPAKPKVAAGRVSRKASPSATTTVAATTPNAAANANAPTLRARLATLYARHALAIATTPAADTSVATAARSSATAATPADDELATTYTMAIGYPLSLAKRALLAASLHGFDAQAAARRLTMEHVTAVATGANPAPTCATTTDEGAEESGGLTLARLDAMTDETWRAFVQWLLEREGYTVERSAPGATGTVWRGERRGLGGPDDEADTAPSTLIVASAVRLPAGWPLEEDAVRRAASAAVSEPGAQALLLTTAPPTIGALLEARRLGVRLLDRAALGERLSGLATAYQREQAAVSAQTQARAMAAVAARERLLAALSATEVAFVGSGALAAKRVTGRATVKAAATQAREAQRLAAQALLAWETLLGEWQASFGERPARDGSLALLAEPATFDELATRGEHLRDALMRAIQRLVTSPAEGELGYGVWRQALSEELLARIQTLRWRAQSLDPDHWQDYRAAHDDDALLEATAATNAAAHAAARAGQAYAQLAERVGLA